MALFHLCAHAYVCEAEADSAEQWPSCRLVTRRAHSSVTLEVRGHISPGLSHWAVPFKGTDVHCCLAWPCKGLSISRYYYLLYNLLIIRIVLDTFWNKSFFVTPMSSEYGFVYLLLADWHDNNICGSTAPPCGDRSVTIWQVVNLGIWRWGSPI